MSKYQCVGNLRKKYISNYIYGKNLINEIAKDAKYSNSNLIERAIKYFDISSLAIHS